MTITDTLYRLITEGLLPGVGSVLSFVPSIAILIFVLTLLRESGLIKGTAAYFIMGFSFSVPAILSCNNIIDKYRKYLTSFLIPYMSCSAKLPIYMLIASTFFPAFPCAVIGVVYATGILMAIAISFSCKERLIPQANANAQGPSKFSYHVLVKEVLTYTLGFIKKAFTVVLLASIVIWFLQNLGPNLALTSQIQDSLLAKLGQWLSPIFTPLGFGDWRATSALITGLSAKEAVVSTLAIIAGSGDYSSMSIMLHEIFTPLSAFSFMVFCLLYMPCISSLIAIKTITKSNAMSLLFLTGHTAVAWAVSFLIFHLIKVIIQCIGGV